MKIKFFIITLSLLLLAFTCEPSYEMEFPGLTEEKYNNLHLEERFQIFINASWYVANPPFIYESVAKEGEKAIPLILEYIESSAPVEKKSRVIQLLIDVNKYYNLKNTKVEDFLLKKAENESDPNLKDYKFVLRIIRPEIEEGTVITPGQGGIPAFYSNDEDIINYAAIIKEKIMQETGITQKELDERFSVVGYAKGEENSKWTIPLDNRTVIMRFVAKIDWIEVSDRLQFYFLDNNSNKLSSEEIKKQIQAPFYFKIKKLKSLSEIEKIVTKTHPKLELKIPPLEAPFFSGYNYIQVNPAEEEVFLAVSGIISKEKNQCVAGTVDLVTGEILVKNTICEIIDY